MALFRGKIVAITGAASGIGRATARLLAMRGAYLSLSDVNEKGLVSITDELSSLYKNSNTAGDHGRSSPSSSPSPPIFSQVLDVRSATATSKWIQSTLSHFESSSLHGAANIAGVAGPSCALDSTTLMRVSEEEYKLVMDVNAGGVANCLRAQLPVMVEGKEGRGGGSIVNVTSAASIVAVPKSGAYTASKHAALGLTRLAAREEGHRGIRVNAVAPGMINTPMIDEMEERVGRREFNAGSGAEQAALGRRGDPEEVAAVVAFLLSEEASFISGVNLPIDGAWLC